MRDRTHGRWLGSTSGIMEASRPRRPPGSILPTHGATRSASLCHDRPGRPHDERAIVDAVLAGDRDAFRRLVERESASLVRACHRILGDLHEAEDAAQEAFVTAFRSLASWRGDGPFGAWLTRIAVRIALRQVGRRRPVAWLDPSTGSGPIGGDQRGSQRRPADRRRSRRTDPAFWRSAPSAPRTCAWPSRAPGALSRGRHAAVLRRAVARRDRTRDRSPARHRQDPAPSRLARLRGTVEPGVTHERSVPAVRPRRAAARPVTEPSDGRAGRRARRRPRARGPCCRATRFGPTAGFEDRVMAAIATEPRPALVIGRRQRGPRRAAGGVPARGPRCLAGRDEWRPAGRGAGAGARPRAASWSVAAGSLTGGRRITVAGLVRRD